MALSHMPSSDGRRINIMLFPPPQRQYVGARDGRHKQGKTSHLGRLSLHDPSRHQQGHPLEVTEKTSAYMKELASRAI